VSVIDWNALLDALRATWQGCLRRYDAAHLHEERVFDWSPYADTLVEFGWGQWAASFRVAGVTGAPDAVDIQARLRVVKGEARGVAAGLALGLDDYGTDDYLVMPAAVYNGNRFAVCPAPYPPLVTDPALRGPDAPTHITDVPRFNIGEGMSRIQLLTRDLSTPAVGLYNPRQGRGLWLLTEQATRLGDSGIEVAENAARTRATITITSPGMRADRRYTIASMNHACEDRAPDWTAGDEITLHLRLYTFDCPDIPALFEKFAAIRKDLTGPVMLKHELPFSASWAIQEAKYNAENWSEPFGYYRVGIGDSPYADWQVGWVGGGMVTHPLLMAGDARSRERARRNLDFLFGPAQAGSGFFYGIGHTTPEGMDWFGDGFGQPDTGRWHLVRKSADALYFAYKQLMLAEKQEGRARIPEAWLAGAGRAAEGFVRLWERYGQFGQFVDVETGDIVVGNSASGSTAAGGLALAYQFTGDETYLRVACMAGEDYYRRFVCRGYTTGGPGEICQCPDSESAFGLLESFVALYEVTGDAAWVAYARNMAHQCATWVTSYDFAFPPDSLFGRMDMRAAGSVWANAQNKHGAPGICTLSGDALFKLYRATGEVFFLELLRELAHNISQYLSRADRPVGGMPPGWMTERVNLSDWLEGVGEIFPGSCWCEVSLMQTYAEVPGLYVQPDTEFVCAIDHVDAAVVEDAPASLVVEVSNPTSFPAAVRVYAEPAADMRRPLGQNALWGGQVVHVGAGQSVRVAFAK
jgi:hypothetical protein